MVTPDNQVRTLRRFDEPVRYRYMRFGFPAGVLLFALIAAGISQGMSFPFVLILLVFTFLVSQATAMSMLAAHRILVTERDLIAQTFLRKVRVAWDELAAVEILDLEREEVPRRFLRIYGRGFEFFIMDSVLGFEDVLREIIRRAPSTRISNMPLWRRLLLLQW